MIFLLSVTCTPAANDSTVHGGVTLAVALQQQCATKLVRLYLGLNLGPQKQTAAHLEDPTRL